MAQSTEPRLPKLPQESASTTNPSFAHQNIQTAPDVALSQKVAGTAAVPRLPLNNPPSQPGLSAITGNQGAVPAATPGASPDVTQPTLQPGDAGKAPVGAEKVAAPTSTAPPASGAETSNYQAPPPTTPVQAGGQGTVQAPGAPPGVPNTTPVAPVPVAPTPKSIEGKNAAEDEYLQAQNEAAQKEYEASLAFNGGPTGALAEDQRKASEGLRAATNTRGAEGTINSSLFAGDKGRISTAQAAADTTAHNTYTAAMVQAHDALAKAQAAWIRAGETERKEIAEQHEREQSKAPVYSMATPTTPGSPTAALTPREIQVNGPPGAGGVVPRSYRSGSGTVTIGGRHK